MKVAIIKYNAGNVRSVQNALNRFGVDSVVTGDPETLGNADKVIFPGVGEASTAMEFLRRDRLDVVIRSLNQPVLAICLGMQLLGKSTEENETACLGIMPYRTRRFPANGIKVPQIGWNRISNLNSPLFDGLNEGSPVYFVHSYYVGTGKDTTATAVHGDHFSAAAAIRNFHAVQFHPEKSGSVGAKIIENFLRM